MELTVLLLIVVVVRSIVYSQDVFSFQLPKSSFNKQLIGYNLYGLSAPDVHFCIRECMFMSVCKSVNYNALNKTCEINSKGSETTNETDVQAVSGSVFLDVTTSTQQMVSGCEGHACEDHQRCWPLGNDKHTCINIDCNEPQRLGVARVLKPGSSLLGAVRSYVFSCPPGTFVRGDTTVICLYNGQWSGLQATCKEPSIGKACDSSADCLDTSGTCIDGRCFCDGLFRFDQAKGDCVRACSSWTTTLQYYGNYQLFWYDINSYLYSHDYEVEDCKRMCLSTPDCFSVEWWCESVNVRYYCWLNRLTMQMALDGHREALFTETEVQYYSRLCNPV